MKASTIKKQLGNFRRVKNMMSNGGNDVPNQFILYFENGTVFQSYNSIIAIRFNYDVKYGLSGKIVLSEDWDYSMTTSKYRNDFLGEHTKETRTKLDSGAYIYCDHLA